VPLSREVRRFRTHFVFLVSLGEPPSRGSSARAGSSGDARLILTRGYLPFGNSATNSEGQIREGIPSEASRRILRITGEAGARDPFENSGFVRTAIGKSANSPPVTTRHGKSGCGARVGAIICAARRDYNGYRKAGLNPAEWAYEWSPFSVIIGALSTVQCRARNWHAKIGCDPIVGHCPIQAAARVAPPRRPLVSHSSLPQFSPEYFVVDSLDSASPIDLRFRLC
jgi:hypothetical protein